MPSSTHGASEAAYLNHGGVVHKTDKAVLFKIGSKEVWVPKSVIIDQGEEQVAVKKWWADKNGMTSDW